MSTITKPPFPVIFSKKTFRKAQKPPTTMLGPFQQMSSKGFVKKIPERMKLRVPSAHAFPVHQFDPLRSEQSISSSWLDLVSSVATMPGKKPEDVDEAFSTDSAVKEAVEYKRKKFVKKLKINKKLGPILLSVVVSRKPRLTPPAFVPTPCKSWRNVPPRGLHD